MLSSQEMPSTWHITRNRGRTLLWEEDPDRPRMLREQFIERASGEDIDTEEFRTSLVKKFNHIHTNVQCLHTRKLSFHIAEGILLARHVPGPIIECGCFKGGNTAKMSILARALGKKLITFDSFQGLPHDEPFTRDDVWDSAYKGPREAGWPIRTTNWEKGMFACSEEDVMAAIVEYGEPDSVELVPGLFENTLPDSKHEPCFIFIDVDLTTSARTCLLHLWDKLRGPRFYSHEFGFPSYVGTIMNRLWWIRKIGCSAPEYVQFIDVPHLAYLKK